MSKKGKISLAILIIIILICAGAIIAWFSFGKKALNDPLFGIRVSEDLGADARELVEGRIEMTRQLYEKEPDKWDTWIAIGNAWSSVGEYEKAISAFQKSLDINPLNMIGNSNIAEIYRQNFEDYEMAEQYYRLAINNNLVDSDLYIRLGRMLDKKMGKKEEAEAVYTEGLEKIGLANELLIELIQLYEDAGDEEKMKEMIQILLERNPDNEGFSRRWGSALE